MAVTTYGFTFWHANYSYSKWDVAWGATSTDQRYFYSLIDSNIDTGPLATFSYTPTDAVRTDNVTRLYFTQTGTTYFQPGSIVEIANIGPDTSTCYSGVVLGGGAGYVDYLNPGLNTANGVSAGTVRAPIHPYWTTGFAWVPSWSSEVTHNQLIYQSALGEGYTQRMNPVINSNSLAWNLTFENRTDKETTALLTFLQDKGGASAFKVAFPVGNLYNRADLQYVAGPPKHAMTAYGLNTVTVPIAQTFDL